MVEFQTQLESTRGKKTTHNMLCQLRVAGVMQADIPHKASWTGTRVNQSALSRVSRLPPIQRAQKELHSLAKTNLMKTKNSNNGQLLLWQ